MDPKPAQATPETAPVPTPAPAPVADVQAAAPVVATPVVEQTPIPPEKEKKKRRGGWIVSLLLFIVIFFLGIGFEKFHAVARFRAIRWPHVLIVMPTPTPPPSPKKTVNTTPTPPANPMADWITCTNATNTLHMKYPPDVAYDKSTCSYTIEDYSTLKDINVVNATEDFRKNWLLSITPEKSTFGVEQWIKAKNFCPESTSCTNFTPPPIPNATAFTLNNVHYAQTNVIVKTNTAIYNFSLNARNPNATPSADLQTLFYQILSTVAFTDQSASASAGH